MATIEFYPLDIASNIEDGKAVIHLYGKTKDDKQICILDDSFAPYCIVVPKKGEDLVELSKRIMLTSSDEFKITKTKIVKRKDIKLEKEVIKVYVALPKEVAHFRSATKDWPEIKDIREHDISFTRKYLLDNKIVPFTLAKADGELAKLHKNKLPCFQATSVEPVSEDTYNDPKILAFDIETYSSDGKILSPDQTPIIMLAVHGKRFSKIITWKHVKHKDIESC